MRNEPTTYSRGGPTRPGLCLLIATFAGLFSAITPGQESTPTVRMSSDNANVQARDNATAINQVNAKYFMVYAHEYSVPIYNVTYTTEKKVGGLSPIARINKAIAQIRTLSASGYDEQADEQLQRAFDEFFREPDLLLSDNGLLALTNLHILKAQNLEASHKSNEAADEYLRPLELLSKRPTLQKSYAKKIVGKPVLRTTPAGLAFVISQECPADPEALCPGLIAARLRLLLNDAYYDVDATTDVMRQIMHFFDRTRPALSPNDSIGKQGDALSIRKNLFADVFYYFINVPSGHLSEDLAALLHPVVKAAADDFEAYRAYIQFDKVSDSDKILGLCFFMFYMQDFDNLGVLENGTKEEAEANLRQAQELAKALPADKKQVGDNVVAAMQACMNLNVYCGFSRVIWQTTNASK